MTTDERVDVELDRAIRILTPREHSVQELRWKLGKRHVNSETIEAVIRRLLELNYLSDERFTKTYVEERINKGDGPIKIRANLQRRGIDRHLINVSVSSDDEFWLARAQEALVKRFDAPNAPLSLDEWKSRNNFLTSRGFTTSVVVNALGPFVRE